MLFNIYIQHGLEIIETPVLNDAKHTNKGVEDQGVHLTTDIVVRDKDGEKRIEYIAQELHDLRFANKCEF